MTDFPKWRDVRADIVASAGGEQAVAKARRRNQAYIDGHRLAERRTAAGLSQAEVGELMGCDQEPGLADRARNRYARRLIDECELGP
jgi:hypothetical protein